ncbi:hypothetical protein E0Z10_g2497 [Xylaria hypoxylon]|uniref:RRM domain-containing protein n=1 Tax=Xylaria hypoxylon TaxID=37992 RepID=A0A4Z0Z3N8_9PEZI|nr:hypothetical protein E0Z10_g2497 [Xylaria hypoxylon]
MASTEVSATRLYLGNLPKGATKQDVEAHFATHGTGEITEIKLMNGFGFIEYKDAMDARDVVPGMCLNPQSIRPLDYGARRLIFNARCSFPSHAAPASAKGLVPTSAAPRDLAELHIACRFTGLPNDTSWQDLKDFARQSSLDVVYSETGRDGNGRGFVEFETAADLKTAVEKLDTREFKGQRVNCVADVGLRGTQYDTNSTNVRVRRNQTSLLVETAVLVHPRADDPTEFLQMATSVELLHVAIVLGAIARIIVIEALAVTTTMTAVIGHLRVADRSRSTAHPVDVMMTPIDGIIRHPIRMSTVVPTTDLRETSPREKVAMPHVKVARILVRIIGEEDTDL